MRRNRDHRHRHVDLCGSVQEQKPVYRALDQHARVLFQQIGAPVVAGGEIEVLGKRQLFDHTAHDAGKVAFAEIGSQHANAEAAALAQRTRKVVRAVIEFYGGVQHALARFLRNRFGGRRIIQNQRDRRLR